MVRTIRHIMMWPAKNHFGFENYRLGPRKFYE